MDEAEEQPLRDQARMTAYDALEQGAMVRVAPETKRKFVAGPEGLALLAIGATSGKAYQPRR